MGKSCAALGCSNGIAGSKLEDSNISFHKFPLRHPELLAVWTSRTGRRLGAFTPTEHSRLCSRHFQRRDFINPDAPKARRLRDDTIPSINLPGFPMTDNYVGKECKSELNVPLSSEIECSKSLPTPIPTCKSSCIMPMMGPITPTLPPSQLRKLAHKMQLGEGSDNQMDPVLRETWEVLASESDYNHSTGSATDQDSTLEDKIVRVKPQLWPQVIPQHHHHVPASQQQSVGHPHHHHHHHHHPHHHQHSQSQHTQDQIQQQHDLQSTTAANDDHQTSRTDEQSEQSLTEEQEQQLEHEESNFRSTATSSIGTESFNHRDSSRIKMEMNDISTSHDDYQPPAKKAYRPHIDCIMGSMPVSTDVSSESVAPMGHYDCVNNPSPATPSGHIHHPHFDLSGAQHRLLNGGVLPSETSAFHLQSDLHIPRPAHRETGTSPWDSLWSEVGKAIRTVADSFAHYLRTKAEIAQERHQCEMDLKGFKPRMQQRSIQTAHKQTNTTNNDTDKNAKTSEEINGHVDNEKLDRSTAS